MASILTNRGMHSILSGSVDLTNDTIKVMLMDASFTQAATHNFVSDISADELTGVGYTAGFAGAGRKTLASKTLTEDDATGTSTFDAADLTWTTITAGTATCAAVIKEVTNDADSIVLGYVGFTPQVTAGGNLVVAWHANGIFRITGWGGSNVTVYQVDYTATGAEGTDFSVTIGSTLASDTYTVVWAPKGMASVPIIDLPDTVAGDRTTTTFRVLTSAQMTAGDVISFVVYE
jgi:hypothetical protein